MGGWINLITTQPIDTGFAFLCQILLFKSWLSTECPNNKHFIMAELKPKPLSREAIMVAVSPLALLSFSMISTETIYWYLSSTTSKTLLKFSQLRRSREMVFQQRHRTNTSQTLPTLCRQRRWKFFAMINELKMQIVWLDRHRLVRNFGKPLKLNLHQNYRDWLAPVGN